MWTWEGAGTWLPLKSAQFPIFRDLFDQVAPEEVREYAPPFLGALQEPGLIQLWTPLAGVYWYSHPPMFHAAAATNCSRVSSRPIAGSAR